MQNQAIIKEHRKEFSQNYSTPGKQTEKFIETAEGRIAYTETGTGQPVILIHCSSASGAIWKGLTETLATRMSCISTDQWGCGKSDGWAGQGSFNIAREAEPIARLIESLDQPVHIVGHSYGGGVALSLARQIPQRIDSLTLIEPSTFHLLDSGSKSEKPLSDEIRGISDSVSQSMFSGDYWSGMSVFIDYWSGAGTWDSMTHEVRMRMAQRLGKVVLDFKALFHEPARLEDYAIIKNPVRLICGDRSPAPSQYIVDLLANALPDTNVVNVPGAGHMSPVTHAGIVNAAIQSHIQENLPD